MPQTLSPEEERTRQQLYNDLSWHRFAQQRNFFNAAQLDNRKASIEERLHTLPIGILTAERPQGILFQILESKVSIHDKARFFCNVIDRVKTEAGYDAAAELVSQRSTYNQNTILHKLGALLYPEIKRELDRKKPESVLSRESSSSIRVLISARGGRLTTIIDRPDRNALPTTHEPQTIMSFAPPPERDDSTSVDQSTQAALRTMIYAAVDASPNRAITINRTGICTSEYPAIPQRVAFNRRQAIATLEEFITLWRRERNNPPSSDLEATFRQAISPENVEDFKAAIKDNESARTLYDELHELVLPSSNDPTLSSNLFSTIGKLKLKAFNTKLEKEGILSSSDPETTEPISMSESYAASDVPTTTIDAIFDSLVQILSNVALEKTIVETSADSLSMWRDREDLLARQRHLPDKRLVREAEDEALSRIQEARRITGNENSYRTFADNILARRQNSPSLSK